ncbi:unnamed protein product, partial [Phaeothamnion confervicola]
MGIFEDLQAPRETMAEIQLIVDCLNEEPFKKSLRLVEFDEKSPLELLQVLQEVFEAIDPEGQRAASFDIRQEADEVRATRMMAFLQMLKFPGGNGVDPQLVLAGLAAGDKAAVYPVLHWCLQRLPQLRKRAYLARYLMPVDVPAEYLQQDPAVATLAETCRQLQQEFKTAHKAVDQARGTGADQRPAELRAEISQLEDERRALQEKVAKIKRATTDEPGFGQMLDAISRLRRAQEEEARLAGKLHEQRAVCAQVDVRAAESQRRLQQLRQGAAAAGVGGTTGSSYGAGGSAPGAAAAAEALLRQLQQEVDGLAQAAGRQLPREAATLRRRLQQLQRTRSEPTRTREEVEELGRVAATLRRENEARQQRAEELLAARNDANLTMFRQQATLAARKLAERQEERENLAEERQKLLQELEERDEVAAAMDGGNGGGGGGGGLASSGIMSREEFKQFSARLRDTTAAYKRAKSDLAALQAEAVVLHRTEQILRAKDARLDGALRQLEAEQGVTGYRDARAALIARSERTAQVDALKGETLTDISALVNSIALELRSKQDRLRPLIEELKGLRQTCGEIEADYQRKRSGYEKAAMGIEVERQQLEKECDTLQEACLREESRFHFLQSLCSIARAQLERVRQEEAWDRGDGRLLPDFKCYKDLYEHKLRQQESMSKQLRRQQKSIREREGGGAEQRKAFLRLQEVLRCKLAAKQRVLRERQGGGGGDLGGLGGGGGYGGSGYGGGY